MSSKHDLRIDFVSHAAVKLACGRWHYSKSAPPGKSVKLGVWESGVFKGVVVFSRGANYNAGRPYGLGAEQICELTRVALRNHDVPVSRIIAVSLKLLSKSFVLMK